MPHSSVINTLKKSMDFILINCRFFNTSVVVYKEEKCHIFSTVKPKTDKLRNGVIICKYII